METKSKLRKQMTQIKDSKMNKFPEFINQVINVPSNKYDILNKNIQETFDQNDDQQKTGIVAELTDKSRKSFGNYLEETNRNLKLNPGSFHEKKVLKKLKTMRYAKLILKDAINLNDKEENINICLNKDPEFNTEKLIFEMNFNETKNFSNSKYTLTKFEDSSKIKINQSFGTNNQRKSKIVIRFLSKMQNVFDSISDLADEERQELIDSKLSHKLRFLIDSKGEFKKIWNLYTIFMILFTVFINPLMFAFRIEFLLLKYILLLIDFSFILDICINFFTQIYDKEDNLIHSKEDIVLKYIFNWLFFDIITSFPFQLFETQLKGDFTYEYILWIKVFKFLRLITYKEIKDFSIISNTKLNSVFKLLIFFFIFIHVNSCFWIFISHSQPYYIQNWVMWGQMSNLSHFAIYIHSLYFSFVTTYSIGYGDIVPINFKERIYVIFLLFIGTMVYSFGISSLSILFGKINLKRKKLRHCLRVLNEINDKFDLETTIYKDIKKFLYHEFKSNNEDVYELLKTLPTTTRRELTIFMYKSLIDELKFFTNQNNDFIFFVLPLLKSHKVNRPDILFSVGEFLQEMYIVKTGCLSIKLDFFYEKLEIGLIQENEHFGELLMQINRLSPYEISCKTKSADLFCLKKNDFEEIKNSFPRNIFLILNQSYHTLEKIDRRRKTFERLHSIEKNKRGVENIKKIINLYLMERDFDQYYYNDLEMEDVNNFIDQNSFENLKKIIQNLSPEKKKKALTEKKSPIINKIENNNKLKSVSVIYDTPTPNLKDDELIIEKNQLSEFKKSNNEMKEKSTVTIESMRQTYQDKHTISDANSDANLKSPIKLFSLNCFDNNENGIIGAFSKKTHRTKSQHLIKKKTSKVGSKKTKDKMLNHFKQIAFTNQQNEIKDQEHELNEKCNNLLNPLNEKEKRKDNNNYLSQKKKFRQNSSKIKNSRTSIAKENCDTKKESLNSKESLKLCEITKEKIERAKGILQKRNMKLEISQESFTFIKNPVKKKWEIENFRGFTIKNYGLGRVENIVYDDSNEARNLQLKIMRSKKIFNSEFLNEFRTTKCNSKLKRFIYSSDQSDENKDKNKENIEIRVNLTKSRKEKVLEKKLKSLLKFVRKNNL